MEIEFTCMSLKEAVGHGWLSAVHPEDLEHILARWRSFQETGEAGNVEGRLRRADGLYRLFNFSASPIADDSGEIVKWCGINTDIDDRKRTEEALRAEASRFRQVFDSLPALVTLMNA
jgi:PAS domain S-box-containing protein